MYRCLSPWAAAVALALPLAVAAQSARNFPQNALRGTLAVQSAYELTLNGQPARFAPGMRIRGADNLLAMSGSLIGASFVANYTVDDLGLVKDVWILSPDEARKQPWPTTAEQAQRWSFDPVAQTWTRQ